MASLIEKYGLTEKVLHLSASKSTREIETILRQEDNVKVSYRAIASFVKGIRQERAESTKALVQETIKATVPRDLEILDELIKKEHQWFFGNDEELRASERIMIAKELRQTIESKLKLTGAGEPDGVSPVVIVRGDPNASK